jgi:hypothetical protein
MDQCSINYFHSSTFAAWGARRLSPSPSPIPLNHCPLSRMNFRSVECSAPLAPALADSGMQEGRRGWETWGRLPGPGPGGIGPRMRSFPHEPSDIHS